MANTLKLFRNGAVGFIDWLDVFLFMESFPLFDNVAINPKEAIFCLRRNETLGIKCRDVAADFVAAELKIGPVKTSV